MNFFNNNFDNDDIEDGLIVDEIMENDINQGYNYQSKNNGNNILFRHIIYNNLRLKNSLIKEAHKSYYGVSGFAYAHCLSNKPLHAGLMHSFN